LRDLLEQFFGAWNEPDKTRQSQDIAGVLSREARYVDPRTPEPLIGPEAIAGYVSAFTEMAPGAEAQVAHVDERDGIIRATIAFVMPDGTRQLGQYFVRADPSGHIEHLVGFVGTGAQA
jgi:hypothetical protein